MKAYDTVKHVELEVTRDDLIQLMRDGRQVDFVLPEPKSDADGYMTWDVEFWSAVDERKFVRTYEYKGDNTLTGTVREALGSGITLLAVVALCGLAGEVEAGLGKGSGLSPVHVAAALAVKAYLEDGHPGTVIYYGCPGEEGGSGKAFMARGGAFSDLDCAITWHPSTVNAVCKDSSLANFQVLYSFRGISAHAAGCPEMGRSALDALELMNVGTNFLREHMLDKARVHYAITDAGGYSPNVVQDSAKAVYLIRAPKVGQAHELYQRVSKIAQGAALMTETTVEKTFIDGLADTITNHALERVLHRNFEALGVPSYTAEELAFADGLAQTYPGSDRVPGVGSQYDPKYAADVRERRTRAGHAMNSFLLPLYQGDAFQPGSTDVGDVSWQCPTAQIHVATWPNGCPGHSWQNVSCGRTDLGHKGAVHAGKVLAAAAIDLLTDPALLEEARAEFQRRTAEGYTCPIPADAVPTIAD